MRKVLTAFFSLGVVSFAHPASAGVEFEAGGVVAELDAAAVTGVVGAFTDGGDLELLWCADGGEARIGHISVEGIAGVRGLLEGVECTAVLALQLPEFGPQPPTFDAPLEVLLAGPDGVYAADFSVGGNTMTSQLLSTPTTALAAGRWDGVPAVVLGHLDGSLSRCPLDLDGCVSLPLPGAPSPVVALAVGDIDGTADPELLVGREDGSFFLLRGSLEPATVVLRSGKLLDRTIDAIGLGEVGPDRRQVIALASSPLAVSATDPGECVLPGAPEWVGAVPDAACSDVRLLNPTWTPDWGEMIAGDVAFPLDSRDRVSTISLADLDRDGFNEAMISVAPRSGDCARPSLPWGRSFLPETGGASNDGAGGVTQALLVDYDGDGDRDLLELGWSCEEAGAQPQPQIDILPLGQGVVQERRDLTLDQGGRTIRQVLWGAGDPSPPLWTLATDAETALVCRIRRAATSPAGKACSAALPFQPNPLPPGMAIRVTAAGEEAAVSLGDRVAILRVSEGGVTLEEDVLPYAWTQVGALAWGSRCQDAPEGPGCASQDVLAVTGVTEQGNLSTVLPFLQLVTPDGPTLSDPLWTWSSLVSDIRWLDATGNGQLDLAISSIAGPVSTLVRSPASPLGYETTWVSSAELETHSLRAEDFDGDGALDLVTFNGLETEGAERMYSNQGGGSFALAGSFGFGEDSRGTSTLDIDSDGRPEIVTTVPQEFCDEGSGQLVVHDAPLLPFDFSPSAGWAPASCGSPQSTDWTSARGRWVGAVGGAVHGAGLVLLAVEPSDEPGAADRPTRIDLRVPGQPRAGSSVLPVAIRPTPWDPAQLGVSHEWPGGCEIPPQAASMAVEFTVFDDDADGAWDISLEFANAGEQWQQGTVTWGEDDATQELPLPASSAGEARRARWQWEADGAAGEHVQVRARLARQVADHAAGSVHFGPRYSAPVRLRLYPDADRDGLWDGVEDSCEHHDLLDCDQDGATLCSGDDCDDADPLRRVGFPEVCDGWDNDCLDETWAQTDDGTQVPGEPDADGDGQRVCAGDCDDTNDRKKGALDGEAAAESRCLDGIDNDCDTAIDDLDPDCVGSGELASLDCLAGYAQTGSASLLLPFLLLVPMRRRRRGRERGPHTGALLGLVAALLLPSAAFGQSGGPDASGYTFSSTPALFVDLQALVGPAPTDAQQVAMGDDSTWVVDLAAETTWAGFPFYGNTYPFLVIDSNGKINFDPLATSDGTNDCLPVSVSTPGAEADIAVLWDDLDPSASTSGGVFTWFDAVNDRFIVSWEGVPWFGTFDEVWVQAHLFGNGDVEVHWDTVDAAGDPPWARGGGATVGIQDAVGGTQGFSNVLAYSCDSKELSDASATTFAACPDLDGDGWSTCAGDCDDSLATGLTASPDLEEVCDGIDNDCDATTIETIDSDFDGQSVCDDDCDDDNGLVYTPAPGETNETCDGFDNDCNGVVDDGFDDDGDGQYECGTDCNDEDASVYLGAPEVCDGVDQNCDGLFFTMDTSSPGTSTNTVTDALRGNRWEVSAATNLHRFTAQLDAATGTEITWRVYEGPGGAAGPWTEVASQTNTTTAPPGAAWHTSPPLLVPLAQGLAYVTAVSWTGASVTYPWSPVSGPSPVSFGSHLGGTIASSAASALADSPNSYPTQIFTDVETDTDGDGELPCEGDCDDLNASVLTSAAEVCDGLDNDCDASTTFIDPVTGLDETDADGDGDPLCGTDCDDGNASQSGTGVEICDGLDNDCDSSTQAEGGEIDGDNDLSLSCVDCDDNDASTYPGADELCDGQDQACDGIAPIILAPPDPSITSAALTETIGSRWTPPSTTFLSTVDALLTLPSGVELTWEVYEAPSPLGPWTPIASASSFPVSQGQPGWQSSPLFNITMQTGTTYAVTVTWSSSLVTYEWAPAATVLPADIAGIYEGGVAAGPSPLARQYAVRITTGVEADQDSDGALGCGGDCDDDDPATYPNAEEVCDGADNDCDGFLPPLEDDGDGDGHIECPPVTGSALLGGDCDDANGDVYPGAAEVCDGVDNDCDNALFVDPQTGVGENADGDGDLSLICDDCDDDDSTVFPGAAELCDGLDSNCNGIAGEVVSALPPTDWMSNANPNRTRGSRWLVSEDETLTHLRAWLNAPEGSAIEWRVYVGPTPDGPWTLSQSLPDTTTGSGSGWHVSPPFDYPLVAGGSYATTVSWTTPAIRFGISTQTSRPFDVPIGQYWGPARINFSGSTLVGTNFNQFSVELIAGDEDDVDGDTYPACDDCDDDDFARNPGSVEVCDGVDNDCDGVLFVDPLTGDGETDSDGDGGMPCNGDCDDTDASVLAGGAEVCDGADNDCDGVAGFPGETIDGDGDGSLACSDCDDTDAALYPLAPETCDGTDNNCQGIQGAVSEPLPPGVPTTVNNDLRGSRWTPSGDTFINQIEAYLTAPSGSDLLWELYEGASPTGPWTAVWSGTSTTSAASPGWEVSPLIGLPLLTGTTYATTVSRTDSDVLVWYASGPTPYSVPVGTYEGGVIGSTGAFGTSTAQYSVRILADAELDNDGDGLLGCDPADCDDEDAGIAAGLAEVCDGVDNDCDGILFSDIYGDESDADGDTFFACLDDDCDDTNADSYPGADELCDLQDNDCDGFLSGAETTDVDGDGSPVCIDCDDQESTSFPGAPKLCDGLDNDCDGFVGLTVEPGPVVTGGNAIVSTGTDRFRGNVVEVTTTTLLSAVQTELNTPVGTTLTFSVLESIQGSWVTVASVQMATTQSGMRVHESPPLNQTLVAGSTYGVGVHWDLQSNYGWENNLTPLAQSFGTIVNGILQFGVPGPTGAAPTLSGLLYSVTMLTGVSEDDLDGDGVRVCAGDCDDDDQAINPGAAETCDDAIDQDCDGVVETSSDQDGDGELDEDCGGADCNDDDPLVFPSAVEACDGLDSDCDGSILGEADDDGDGFRICGGDCDDTAATINPTALVELCDGADTDCDGTIPLDEADIDGDGYRICSQPSDCNDLDAAVAPFLLDDCGDGDENCNGVVDDDCPPEESDDDDVTEPDDDDSANDLDGDGVTWPDDCDDEDDTVYPGADEICDDKDNDCDGLKLPFEADVDTDGWMRCEGDCDDSLAEVHPEAIEDCGDALDNDCNGLTDVEDEACDDAEGAPASGVTCYGCGGELASSVSGFWVLMIAGTGLRRRRRDPAESLT